MDVERVMPTSKAHREKIRQAVGDEHLQTALNRAISAYKKARAAAMDGFDLARSQDAVRALKQQSIAGMEALVVRFKQEAEAVGAVVHEAADGVEAAEIVKRLCDERGISRIVKSKSMLTEEIELNSRLESAGLQVTETDLGEWIIQLAGEKPSHFTAPALHKTREQVAELFTRETGEDQDSDIAKLVAVARRNLRQAFIDAEMGISGANVAIAETGTIVIVANEGNDRLVTTLPPIHVAIVGLEKLVATQDDANEILKVLARSGTGQKQTAYVSLITGPSRTTDIEKTLTLGVHGPRELHIIFVDAGRRAMAADEQCSEALYCIKCGACLSMCPVYHAVGGHAYGNAYMGGIGAVVTAFHHDLARAEETVNMCAGCGKCESICPSRVDVPRMILEMRRRLADANGMAPAGRAAMMALRHQGMLRNAVKTARAAQFPLNAGDGLLRDFPLIDDAKRLPAIAPKFLRDLVPERSFEAGSADVTFYAGCMIDFLYPEIGESICKVLTGSGLNVMFPKDQSCCGAPALYVGDQDTARKLAVDNILALERGLTGYIVTGCPTCAMMLGERFPTLLAGTAWEERATKLSRKVIDFSQYAVDVLGISIDPIRAGSATYHDPCHQVRGLGTSDRSRALIAASGMELVEMVDSDECCGFAGSYSIKQPEISASMLDRKLGHVSDTGAGTLVTDCPGCILQLRGGLAHRGQPIEVCHTAQIVAEAME